LKVLNKEFRFQSTLLVALPAAVPVAWPSGCRFNEVDV